MSAACGCDEPTTSPADEAEEAERPWWRDPGLVVPILSGVAFGTGLALEWSGLHIAALVAFWAGLLLGAYTFVPGAIRNLVVKRKLGIALLMTISAVGAVILGYVEEAAALAFLYSIAEALEDKAMDRARGGLRALLKLVPETATVLRDGTSASVPAREIAVGDVLLVRPGERVATDGLVRSGRSSLDTSAITGESIPVEVAPGEAVSAGAINSAGVLEVEATAAGTDNSLTTIVELVEQAQAEKGDRARIADRIARPLVPGVMVLAVLVGVLGSLLGDPETWITRALVVLVAASPCALAIAVPVTVVSAIGAATKFGVVIKSGAAFERLGGIRHLAVDKTGTLTRNRPEVTAIVAAHGFDDAQVLAWAAAVEQHSTHPLAAAIAAATGSSTTRSAAYRYETVRINKSPYLVGGIDVDAVRALNGHWEIEGRWPGDGEVLIGLDVAESTGFKVGSTVNAEYLGSDDLSLSSTVSSSGDTAQAAGRASWRVSGIVDTGGSEDDILYVPLGQLESLTGSSDAGYDVVEFSVDTTSVAAADVAAAVNRAADAAGQEVRAEPVSKITSGDTRIITMLDTLFWVVAVVVLGLTLVGVSTTMTVIVSERRNEIGLRKALGASSRSIAVEFYTEAACLGLIGGLIGTAIGYALARAVGIGVFEQPIGFSWWLALLSVLLSALVAVIASAGPVQGATRIDPALVLREE